MPKYKQYELKAKKSKNGKQLKPQTRWMVKGYLGIDPKTGKQKETTLRGFKNKTAAEKGFADAQYKFEHGLHAQTKAPRIKAAYEKWFQVYKNGVEPSTARLVKETFNNHILSKFGDVYIDKLTLLDVQQWVDDTATHFRFYRTMAGYLSMLMKFAVQNGWIESNPFTYIRWPKNVAKSNRVQHNYFSLEQLKQFLATLDELAAKDTRWNVVAAFLTLIAMTGMRSGEAVALRWADIDFQSGVLSIKHHIQNTEESENTMADGAKAHDEGRKVMLNNLAVKALKRWQVKQASVTGIGSEWVFTSSRFPKKRMSISLTRYWMQDACEAAGLDYITVHGLRHTKATLMNEDGTSIGDIAHILGHSSPNTTAKSYIHSNLSAVTVAEENFASMLS